MEERRRGFALSGTRRSAYRKVAHRGDARCDARDADVQFPYRIDEFRQMVVSAIDQPFSLFFSLSFSPLLFLLFSFSLTSAQHRSIPAGIRNPALQPTFINQTRYFKITTTATATFSSSPFPFSISE